MSCRSTPASPRLRAEMSVLNTSAPPVQVVVVDLMGHSRCLSSFPLVAVHFAGRIPGDGSLTFLFLEIGTPNRSVRGENGGNPRVLLRLAETRVV